MAWSPLGRSPRSSARCSLPSSGPWAYAPSLRESIHTTTAVGHMLIGIFGAPAQYERTLINERSVAAREAARARGRHVGRPAALTPDQIRQLRALHRSGEGVPALVATFGVSRATVYRLLSEETSA